jgi:putative transposase
MCRVLGISRSGYYAWLGRHKLGHSHVLVDQVKQIHYRVGQCYGSRRMARALQDEGYPVGRYLARKLMQLAGIAVRRKRKYRVGRGTLKGYPLAPNRLDRQFTVSQPDRVWGVDMTCVWTRQGWLHLAVVIDLYSRKVVGWAFAGKVNQDLALRALRMAIHRRQPSAGVLHHSDRGGPYAGTEYIALLNEHDMVRSMSRAGDCWDNAVVERFFGSLKRERTYFQSYTTKAQAREDLIDYIERFYNEARLHSYLGYISPNEFECVSES